MLRSLRGDNRWRAASGAASKGRFPQLRLHPSSSCAVWYQLAKRHFRLQKVWKDWKMSGGSIQLVPKRDFLMFKRIPFPTAYIEMQSSIVGDLRRSNLYTTPSQNFYVHCKVYHRIVRTDQDWPDVSSGLV